MYPEKTILRKDTCTPVFIAALFTIAKTWKQPKCSLTDEWIKKMWYIYTIVGLNSQLEVLSFTVGRSWLGHSSVDP